MLEINFLLTNTHFTINLLAALTFFAISWLYFDAYSARKSAKELVKMLGFLLLSLSFAIHATNIDQTILTTSALSNLIAYSEHICRTLGYIILIISQVSDPLQPKPTHGNKEKSKHAQTGLAFLMIGGMALPEMFYFLHPILAALIAFLYIRRATTGLEYHLRPIGYGLTLLAISELVGISSIFNQTTNVDIEKLVKPFGIFWVSEHILLLFTLGILGRWAWSYLIKRLETQLFIVFTTSTLLIFLTTTIFFTTVSLANQRNNSINNLAINVSVLKYAIETKKAGLTSDAQLIAQNPQLTTAISTGDKALIRDLATTSLIVKRHSYMVIVSKSGEILARGEDPEKTGGSLSEDPYFKKTLTGSGVSGIVTQDAAVAPILSVRAAEQIKLNGETIGVVILGQNIDSAFVDGLKSATGLDASIYSDNIRSATTFVATDGKSRYVGIKEENEAVKQAVLLTGGNYSGDVTMLNTPFLGSYSAIKDIEDNTIGMLFVGVARITTIQAASKLIQQTFMVTVALLIISIFPAYFISKHIVSQLRS